jgi:hypothetical protein
MNYQQLYSRLTTHLREQLPAASIAQARNQALMTQALVFSPNCHLATLATILPMPGQRENPVQRIRCWLANQAVTQYRSFIPLVRKLFAQWSGKEIGLILDRTDIEHQWSILTLAVAFRHCALSLAWRVLSFGATSAETQLTKRERSTHHTGKDSRGRGRTGPQRLRDPLQVSDARHRHQTAEPKAAPLTTPNHKAKPALDELAQGWSL